MPEKYKIVRVTKTEDYILPISPDGTTYNGQTVDEIVQEWFRTYSLNRHHASRDASRIGNSVVLLDVTVVDENPDKNSPKTLA